MKRSLENGHGSYRNLKYLILFRYFQIISFNWSEAFIKTTEQLFALFFFRIALI